MVKRRNVTDLVGQTIKAVTMTADGVIHIQFKEKREVQVRSDSLYDHRGNYMDTSTIPQKR